MRRHETGSNTCCSSPGSRCSSRDSHSGSSTVGSKTCSCCGERGYRQGRRFHCTNDKCDVAQDHADWNASVNIAWREKAKLDGNDTNYRTHKTQPQVRLVRLSGSGRVSRPPSSRSLAEQGVLAHG
nr:zinc ribbon domain-containing protein [Natronorubrum aibiense]